MLASLHRSTFIGLIAIFYYTRFQVFSEGSERYKNRQFGVTTSRETVPVQVIAFSGGGGSDSDYINRAQHGAAVPGVVCAYYLVIEPGLYPDLGGLCDPLHAPGSLIQLDAVVRELHVGRHRFRHRHAEYASHVEPRPLARFVDRVLQRDLILAVQGLGHGARGGRERSRTIGAEVGTVGRIYADQAVSPPILSIIKAPPHLGDTCVRYLAKPIFVLLK